MLAIEVGLVGSDEGEVIPVVVEVGGDDLVPIGDDGLATVQGGDRLQLRSSMRRKVGSINAELGKQNEAVCGGGCCRQARIIEAVCGSGCCEA